MSMLIATLLCVLLAQRPEPFSHDAVNWMLDKQSSELIRRAETETGALVAAGKFDELRQALGRIEGEAPQGQDQWVSVLGPVLLKIGNTSVQTSGNSAPVNGSIHPEVRRICAPYVRKILDSKWSAPTFCGLWDIQMSVLFKFHNAEPTWNWKSFQGDPKLRKQYVADAAGIWTHVVQSCLLLKKDYPEELVRGDPDAREALPKELHGSSVVPASDPNVQKQEREAFERRQRFWAGFAQAKFTSQYRRRHLEWLRKTLESLYGEDRTKWNEVRETISEEVKDPELAKLIIKEFTQRKKPDIWP